MLGERTSAKKKFDESGGINSILVNDHFKSLDGTFCSTSEPLIGDTHICCSFSEFILFLTQKFYLKDKTLSDFAIFDPKEGTGTRGWLKRLALYKTRHRLEKYHTRVNCAPCPKCSANPIMVTSIWKWDFANEE